MKSPELPGTAVQGIFVFVEKLHRIEYNITDDSGRRIWERGLYGIKI